MGKQKKQFNWLFWLLFVIACYIVFVYPVLRLLAWGDVSSGSLFWLALTLWALGALGMWYSFRDANMAIRYVVVHWMGVGFIAASVVLIAEPLALLLPQARTAIATVVVVITAALSLLAVLQAHTHQVIRVALNSPKLSKKVRIVQISDIHIGSRKPAFLDKLVDKINRLAPDYVVITGDLIDSSAVIYADLQSLRKLSAKTYYVSGNHERYADLENILSMLGRLGIEALRQQAAHCGEIIFLGIDDADDADDAKQVARHLPQLPINSACFNILLYHKPHGWQCALDCGIDLMLSGHTHDGQIFPFNLLVKRQFKFVKGLHSRNQQHLYVNQGSGTWGPIMRLNTVNEITLFELNAQQ